MWRCTICGYEYDDAKEGVPFEQLPDDWTCPVCNAPKDAFEKVSQNQKDEICQQTFPAYP